MKLKRPSPVQICWIGGLALVLFLPIKAAIRTAGVHRLEYKRIHSPSTYTFPNPELAELDHLLQARFAVVPTNNFGLLRIGPRHEIFKAIGPAEREAIEALRSHKIEVVFYVAGRNCLQRKHLIPSSQSPVSAMQGPVYMTQKLPLDVKVAQSFGRLSSGYKYPCPPIFQTEKRPADLPTEAELRVPLGLMLISNSERDHTATPDGKTYRTRDWQVTAVPVRATDKACVDCHYHFSRPVPKLGDPLGIALYAFRPAAKGPKKTVSVPLPAVPPEKFFR